MKRHPALWAGLMLFGTWFAVAAADEPTKVPADSRLGPPKELDPRFDAKKQFLWTPPTSKEAWEKRRQDVREQLLVANGLWPMPQKTPLKPVIHGKIEREGYTIEK